MKNENKTMKKVNLFCLLILLLFACSDKSNENGTETTTDKKLSKDEDSNTEYVDIKTLFKLSPLSIFDKTAEGLTSSEKENLLKKGKSKSWKIIDLAKSKLTLQGSLNDEVKLYALKYKNNPDGLLAVETTNGSTSKVELWKYYTKDKSFEKSTSLKEVSANDFLSGEDKLPNSYQPQLHYNFVDDQTIEVSLYTWMDKEFGEREIVNRIFLKWNGEKFEEQIVKNEEVQKTSKFNILDKPTYDLSQLKHEGEIVHKRFWQDSNGENIALFTKKDKEELFVYHYTINSNQVKQLREVKDFEKECEYDMFLDFIENSIIVTDLDNNNLGEITFAYKKACISDISPKELRLIMLENGNKFTLRGTTSIDKPGIKIEGSKKVDASFDNAPASFRSHANKVWDKIEKE